MSIFCKQYVNTWDVRFNLDINISKSPAKVSHYPCPGQADGWWWHGFINRLVFHFKAPQKAEILRPDMESLSTNLLAKWYIPIKILVDYKMSRDRQTTRPRPPRRIRTFFPHSVRCFFCLASSSVSGFYYGIMALLCENTSRNYSTESRQAFPKVQNKLFCFYRLLFSLVWLYFLNHKY